MNSKPTELQHNKEDFQMAVSMVIFAKVLVNYRDNLKLKWRELNAAMPDMSESSLRRFYQLVKDNEDFMGCILVRNK